MNQSSDLNDEYLCQKYVYAFRGQYDRAICLRVEKLLTVEKGAALVKLFPHVCSKCKLRFASNVDLTAHTERHRIAGDNAFCEFCGNIYSSLDDLLRHESSEHVGKNLLSGGDGQVEIIGENHAIFASLNISTNQAAGLTMVPFTNNTQLIGSQHNGSSMQNMSWTNGQEVSNPTQLVSNVSTILNNAANFSSSNASVPQYLGSRNSTPLKFVKYKSNNSTNATVPQAIFSVSQNNVTPMNFNDQDTSNVNQQQQLEKINFDHKNQSQEDEPKPISSKQSTKVSLSNSKKCLSSARYLCYVCNETLLDVEDFHKHYQQEHSIKSKNHLQRQSKQSANNIVNSNSSVAQSQQSINDTQPLELETTNQNLQQQHQFQKMLSQTNNESVINEKQLDVEPQQESSNDEDNLYSPTCSSIENVEQEEKNSSNPDFEVKVIPKIPEKRGPEIKSKAEDPQTCPDSGKKFVFPCVMQRDRVVHSKTKVFTCNYCETGFKQKNDLIQHIVTIHRKISDRQYDCSECGTSFPSTALLRRHHVVFHTDPKTWPFQCGLCGKPFVARGELNYHMRKHTNERPFACDVCHMSFKQKSHLANHIRSMKHEQRSLSDDDESNGNDAREVVVEN